MKASKLKLLEETVNITKEYARSGATSVPVDTFMDSVFNKLNELNDKIEE